MVTEKLVLYMYLILIKYTTKEISKFSLLDVIHFS